MQNRNDNVNNSDKPDYNIRKLNTYLIEYVSRTPANKKVGKIIKYVYHVFHPLKPCPPDDVRVSYKQHKNTIRLVYFFLTTLSTLTYSSHNNAYDKTSYMTVKNRHWDLQ